MDITEMGGSHGCLLIAGSLIILGLLALLWWPITWILQ